MCVEAKPELDQFMADIKRLSGIVRTQLKGNANKIPVTLTKLLCVSCKSFRLFPSVFVCLFVFQ